MRVTLGNKLIAGFILVILLMVALALYSVRKSQKTLQESVGKDSVILAEEILSKIDQNIYQKIEILQAHSKDYFLQKSLSESNREFEKLPNVQEHINQRDREWVFTPKGELTPFMEGLLNNNLSNALREEFTEFYERKYGYRMFPEVYVVNKYGVVIASTGRTSDYLQADEEWYQKALSKQVYWVGDAEYDKSSGIFSNDIVLSLYDDSGDFAGILKGIIDIGIIIREAEIARKTHQTTRIKVITKDGNLIYSTKTFRFYEDVSSKEFFKKIEGEDGFFIADEGGRAKMYSYSCSKGYKGFEGFGWILLLGHDKREILRPSYVLRNNMVVASLILIAMGIIVAFIISRSITKPIAELTKATGMIGKRDFTYRIDIKTKDEIGVLASAYNEMVKDLDEVTASRDDLDKEVAERKAAEKVLEQRTHDLDERVKELNCLYEISSLAQEQQISIEKIFQRVVELIPPSWQYPEITCARVSWGVDEFRSKNFSETQWRQTRDIVVNREQVGVLGVFYMEERPEMDEGPFLKEEGDLLNAIAERLGKMIEHWQVEEELRKHREQLEELIQERTDELNNRILEVEQLNSSMVNLLEDLRTSNENLELTTHQLSDANKELESFSYSVSHDLRAPLRAIDGFSQMLVEDYGDKLDEDGQHQLDVIQSSARDMGHLIDDLLAFSRLGRKEIKMSEIDMGILVEDVLEQLHVGETDRTARLNIDSLPPSKGDRTLIREVYVNLLSNAIKFAKSGETPVIEISGTVDGDEIFYSVKDNGVGFDMKYADKLFQVFQRLHSAEQYEGTGIGLALIQRIIHRHGGRVWAEGKVDEGATFYFSLPRS